MTYTDMDAARDQQDEALERDGLVICEECEARIPLMNIRTCPYPNCSANLCDACLTGHMERELEERR